MKLVKGTCHTTTTKIILSVQHDSKFPYRTLHETAYAVINWKIHMSTKTFWWRAGHIFKLGEAPFLSISFGGPLNFLGYGVMKKRMLQHLVCAIRRKEECCACLPHLSRQSWAPLPSLLEQQQWCWLELVFWGTLYFPLNLHAKLNY